MLFLPVVFYGRRGLEADVFESYMSRSGYPVQVVLVENGHLPSVANEPSSIAVIALGPTSQGMELARQIQMETGGCARVFILNAPEAQRSDDPSVEIIPKPYQLSQVVKRIQRVSRGI